MTHFNKTLLITFLIFSHSALAQKLDKEVDAFPPDFGKTKTYVFVIKKPGYFQVNNALEKTFEKYYTGKYEIIESINIPYNNLKGGVTYYTFETIFDEKKGYWDARQERVPPTTNYSYGIKDLSTDKLYKLSFFGGGKKLMENYVKKLEEIRVSNGGN